MFEAMNMDGILGQRKNALYRLLRQRMDGISCGITSFCTANDLVIEAILEDALEAGSDILIEATANQVNQFGGYTGMLPEDFRDYVYSIAERTGFPKERLILGGDHLGPLVWASRPEAEAMELAKELVSSYVLAGYKKIHLDTSMRLGDDPLDAPLTDETIAQRGAQLYLACEQAFQKLKTADPESEHPLFIIGSEVPVPGGIQEPEESVSVTKPEAAGATLATYKRVFEEHGLLDAFDYIIGIVVQPGVEFGDADIYHYDRDKAHELCEYMKQWPELVMEGHSTDYQSAHHLRQMVEDGIAILKVGPALTFALRKGLFALSFMEKELVSPEKRSCFIELLDRVMVEAPDNWKKHYHGTAEEIGLKRKYSFSDRCRYYLTHEEVQQTIRKLFNNFDGVDIPLGMIQQYMPDQYLKVRDNQLRPTAKNLVKDMVATLVSDYTFAVRP